MKRYAIAAATALSVALGAQAVAQNVAVEIAPDQRTIMREYVVRSDHLGSVGLQVSVRLQ